LVSLGVHTPAEMPQSGNKVRAAAKQIANSALINMKSISYIGFIIRLILVNVNRHKFQMYLLFFVKNTEIGFILDIKKDRRFMLGTIVLETYRL
jgi:hypothetical protein